MQSTPTPTHMRMELPQCRTVRDGEKRDAEILSILIHRTLDVDRHCAGTFVQQRILWPVVIKTRHPEPLPEKDGWGKAQAKRE